jgi:CheY-like chemotaxis protein
VLWVDDKMSNNAFQIAQLHDAGVTVVQSPSTEDAMAILASSPPFDAVISDMGRREGGRYDQNAGLTLLRRMREGGFLTPFIVYSSQKYAERNRAEVIAATGDGATSSPVELMEWVRSKVQA